MNVCLAMVMFEGFGFNQSRGSQRSDFSDSVKMIAIPSPLQLSVCSSHMKIALTEIRSMCVVGWNARNIA